MIQDSVIIYNVDDLSDEQTDQSRTFIGIAEPKGKQHQFTVQKKGEAKFLSFGPPESGCARTTLGFCWFSHEPTCRLTFVVSRILVWEGLSLILFVSENGTLVANDALKPGDLLSVDFRILPSEYQLLRGMEQSTQCVQCKFRDCKIISKQRMLGKPVLCVKPIYGTEMMLSQFSKLLGEEFPKWVVVEICVLQNKCHTFFLLEFLLRIYCLVVSPRADDHELSRICV